MRSSNSSCNPPGVLRQGDRSADRTRPGGYAVAFGAGQSGDCRHGLTEPGCLGPPGMDGVPLGLSRSSRDAHWSCRGQTQALPADTVGGAWSGVWPVSVSLCRAGDSACSDICISSVCVYVCPARLAFSVSFGNDTRYNHSLFRARLVLPLLLFNFLSPLMSPRALCPSVARCPYIPPPWIFVLNDLCPTRPAPSHRLAPRPWAVPQREGQRRCRPCPPRPGSPGTLHTPGPVPLPGFVLTCSQLSL